MVKYCFFILYLILFCACSQKPSQIPIHLPNQNPKDYISINATLKTSSTKALKQEYLKHFFAPFSKNPKHTSTEVKWGLQQALQNYGFGENLQPYTLQEIQFLEEEADFDNFPNAKKPAIITRSCDVRVLPTNKPRFFNPKQAGEGYPFDYWQNSSIYLGTPVLITHYSKSKKWVFIESGFVSGWVESLNVAILDNHQIQKLKNTKDFLVVKKDYTPLRNTHNEFLESARIGMLLPLIGSTKNLYESFIFTRTQRGFAKEVQVHLSTKNFTKFPMRFSSQNYASLAQNIIGEKYGWGGMLGNRDCSMFLRDTLGNFGFYLPRNSQAQIGKNQATFVDLSHLNPLEKILAIKNHAIPFATLLGMKGHIMLYIGEINGEIFALHDIWGLKTLQNETQEGRKIIGKIAITPLNIGENIQGINQDTLLIKGIYGMRNLFNIDELEYAKQ